MPAVPEPIRARLADVIATRWSGRDEAPPQPPTELPLATVTRLVSGGPFGWMLDARLDRADDGRLVLEVLEDSRMAGPDHYRLWPDGTHEPLPSEWTGYAVPPGASPEERDRIEAGYFAHNRAVGDQLRERGFR